ncbi:MAG: cadherin repeat domain-containing protein, partial [Ekhidna sp.]|nr:cadherin repeat domain-containing protein [Ekhidna sp.]
AEGDNMTFDMVNNGDIFGLDARNGKLVVNDDLDFETTQSYTLKVSVSDGKLSSNADITVNVTDVDENQKPVIADQTFSIAENTASGVDIGTIVATDPNMTDDLTFTITAGNADGVFALNRSTGVLSTAGALDFETTESYTLKVNVSDGKLIADATITVDVSNVNDNAPVFPDSQTFTVAEDATVGTSVGTVQATDADTNSTLTFTLVDVNYTNTDGANVSPTLAVFALDGATGALTTAGALDYETARSYTLWITVSDGGTEQTASVTVNVTDVFDAVIVFHADNGIPRGMWSDETTMWVADNTDAKIYAYNLADGMRQESKEFNLHADNNFPYGIWSDETTMWVADGIDDKIYAYNLADGMRQESKEFNLHADNLLRYEDNGDPEGMWSDETTMWVADRIDDKIYAYNLADGMRQESKEFSLHADNGNPRGIWSDETTMWVVGNRDDKVYAYSLADGSRQTTKEFDLHADHNFPYGIWSDGTTMWVSELGRHPEVYAYPLPK